MAEGDAYATAARLRTLAANADRAVDDLHALVERAPDAATRLRAERSDLLILMGAGGLLHGFYSTLEGLMRDVADSLGGLVPSGPDWHARLLDQMTHDVPGVRPALLPSGARPGLDELRAFRHLFRNLYVLNLRPEPIEALLGGLPALWESLSEALAAFATALRATAQALENG